MSNVILFCSNHFRLEFWSEEDQQQKERFVLLDFLLDRFRNLIQKEETLWIKIVYFAPWFQSKWMRILIFHCADTCTWKMYCKLTALKNSCQTVTFAEPQWSIEIWFCLIPCRLESWSEGNNLYWKRFIFLEQNFQTIQKKIQKDKTFFLLLFFFAPRFQSKVNETKSDLYRNVWRST